MLNNIIVKVQKVYSAETAENVAIIRNVNKNLKGKSYAELKLICVTMTAQQIAETYGKS